MPRHADRLAAARAGKHVLVEKPMARNADEAQRMLDAAQDAGVRHMVGFNYRRVPAIVLARQMIEQGSLGASIISMRCTTRTGWSDPDAAF